MQHPISPTQAPVIFLLGPTASGKTACAIRLVEAFPKLDIISVDSAMVYRRMNIGTGKPSSKELQRAPHRLIDIREPWETYSAADFSQDARQLITEIHAQGRVPLLVGGTFLYFKALQYGLSNLPAANPALRSKLAQQAEQQGWPVLHETLQKLDPLAAARIKPNDSQRITRALEVYHLTGKSLSCWHQEELMPTNTVQPTHTFILYPNDRHILHANIEIRFRKMIAEGFVEEVAALLQEKNISASLLSMKSVGYRQIAEYLLNDTGLSLDDAIDRSIAATRQLAKRQLTWIRNLTSSSFRHFQEGDSLFEYFQSFCKSIT